jgi:hypothetical protein
MTGLVAVLLLQVMIAPDQTTATFPRTPGSEYWWQDPCIIATPDAANPIERLAAGWLSLSVRDTHVVRCVQPKGATVPAMWSKLFEDGTFLMVYSEEFEAPTIPVDVIRGLVAHEVAHVRLGVTCDPPGSREEYLNCEASVDREAAILVGPGAVKAAIEGFHRLHLHMAAESLARTRVRLIDERLKRFQQAPAAP